MSALANAISEGKLVNQLLIPYPGRGIGKYKDGFNYWLSHSRQSIERPFGMLTKRWGNLLKKV
jgi:hypothetical protein